MTITLDSKTLNCDSIQSEVTAVGPVWDAWESGTYKRKAKTYGAYRTWTLHCWEKDVAWASSAQKNFEDKAASGAIVTFTSDEPIRPVTSTNVLIRDVRFNGSLTGTVNIRYFTVTIQEV